MRSFSSQFAHFSKAHGAIPETVAHRAERAVMDGTIETSLTQVSRVSRTLKQASDELSTQVAGLECALNACGLGVSAWVEEPIFTESEITEPEGTDHLIEINYE